MPKFLLGRDFIKALAATGAIPAAQHVLRVVIDARWEGIVLAHVELIGDDRILEVVPTLEGVDIRTTEAVST